MAGEQSGRAHLIAGGFPPVVFGTNGDIPGITARTSLKQNRYVFLREYPELCWKMFGCR
jgi:hypothetical protein